MENEKNQATIIIEEDQGPVVEIPLEKYEALVRADTILSLLHAVKQSNKITYKSSIYEDVLAVAPDVICAVIRMKEEAHE